MCVLIPEQKAIICSQEHAEAGYCDEQDVGKFILSPNATELSKNLILSEAVHLKSSQPIKYDIKNTGYYCVLTDRFTANNYDLIVEFRNAFGELPATQIPKLPFYGGITLLYFFVAAYWGFLYYQHHSDICKSLSEANKRTKFETNSVHSAGSELHNGHSDIPGR